MRTKYFDYYHDDEALRRYLKSIFSFVLMLSLLWFAAFSLLGPTLFDLIFPSKHIDFYPYGLIASISALSSMSIAPFFIYLRNKYDIKNFTKLTLVNIILSISLQLYLVTFLDDKVLGILIGGAIPNFLVLIYLILKYDLIRWQILHNKEMILSSLRFSLPLIPYTLLELLISKGDRYFIAFYLDLGQVGLYALLMTIVILIEIVLNALDNSLRPVIFDLFKKGPTKNMTKISQYFSFYVICGIVSLYGLFIMGNHLEFITDNSDYLSIRQYFGFATTCMIPLLFVRIFNLQLMFYGKSKEISWLTFYKTVAIIVLFIFLIPTFELWGALVAIFISNIFTAFIFWIKSRKLIPKAVYNLKIYVPMIAFFIISTSSFHFYNYNNPSILQLLHFSIFLSVSIFIYWKKILPKIS